jgi:UDP-GlcNAc:undecaprenyl-phosphate/decaprenyl-phosphate GlcNAc-1-phosphate transferase
VAIVASIPAEPFLFVATMVGTALATPVAIKAAIRIGLVDRPAPHKFHQRATPYLGGAAVGLPVLVALVAALALVPERRVQATTIAVAGLAIAGIGLLDDWMTLRALPRLTVQAAGALSLWASGIRISATGSVLIDLPLMVFVMLAVTNAVNLLDNMDGISAGTVAIACVFFFLAAYSSGQRLVPILALALAGACVGFLPFNFSPARIFLGDAGALFMGFIVGALALKLELPGYPAITRFAVPALILAVPMFDMSLVVLSRWRAGRPVFRGGTDHSSHRLVAVGASPRMAALLTYAATTLCGTSALFLLVARSPAATWAVLAAGTALAGVLLWRFEKVPLATPDRLDSEAAPPPRGAPTASEPVVVSAGLVTSSATLPRQL